jgi:glycosyltransferase involved in cell wall biosynthesis
MKVAIVHDQLCEFGGAERVLVVLKKIFPQADIFTTVFDIDSLGSHKDVVKNWKVNVSWFGKIPVLKKFYSPFRFLTPTIWESFDFSGYDLVISSSGSWMSKGVITNKPTIHISYIHHPPRYLYGYETSIEWQKYWPVKIYGNIINHFLRLWDFKSSQRPDYLIVNSEETKKRVKKFYHRDSTVIYPPVNIPKKISDFKQPISNFYITVSRLTRAKHIDTLIKTANKLRFNLKIVGTGRDEKYLKSIAGPTVEFMGNISDEELDNLYKHAAAFLFSAVDDEFGIAPVEAMGHGLPVIAYRSGGLPEYIRNGVNGFLFDELSVNLLVKKVNELTSLNKENYLNMRIEARKTAERFSEEKFKKQIQNFVKSYARTS